MSDDSMLAAALARIEAGQSALAETVARMGVQITGMDGRLDRMEGQFVRLRVDVMARMDRLRDDVSGIHDNIAVLMAIRTSQDGTMATMLGELRATHA